MKQAEYPLLVEEKRKEKGNRAERKKRTGFELMNPFKTGVRGKLP